MALDAKDERIDLLADELARVTGESPEQAVVAALEERLARVRPAPPRRQLTPEQRRMADDLMEIGRRFAALPATDPRSPEEVWGYDENGLPT
jgi:antitoxin VapB